MINEVYEFPEINYSEKKFVADYAEREKTYESERAKTEKISRVRTLSFISSGSCVPPTTAKKVYFVGGDIYFYCENGKVYKAVKNSDTGAYVLTAAGAKSYSSAPNVIAIKKNGEKKILVFGKDGAEIIGESASLSVSYGKNFAVVCGRLFVAQGKEIKFSEEFDCVNFSTGINGAAGVIRVGGEDGEILCTGASGDELVILCKRSIFVLSAAGEPSGWRLKKVDTCGFSAEENSAAWCGGKMIFRSGKRTYVYYKSALKEIGGAIDDKSPVPLGGACAFGSVYLLPLKEDEKKFVYAYDSATGEEFFPEYIPLISDKGGAGFDEEKGEISFLAFGTAVVTGETSAGNGAFSPDGAEDFGSSDEKLLLRAVVTTNGIGKIKISGDSDGKTYPLVSGLNLLKIGITSRKFTIGYSGFSAGKGVVRAEFTYCLRGY